MNKKIIIYSLIAFGFLYLMYSIDWLFILGAVFFMYLNQKELSKKTKKEKK